MKGYKAFDKDLKCRGFQYAVGSTAEVSGEIALCGNGLHFCQELKNVFNYYEKSYENTRVCEVEAIGEIKTDEDKSVTNKLRIVRELSKEEIKNLTGDLKFNSGSGNSGDYNSGYYNSGNRNSGNRNSGHYNSRHDNSGSYNSGSYNSGRHNSGSSNSGSYNSGSYNSGHSNSGDYNSGNFNSGSYNSGRHNSRSYNSGDFNSGDYNSGDYNSGDRNSGYFNTNTPKVRLFNLDSELEFNDERLANIRTIFNKYYKLHFVYVSSKDMTDKEKQDHPYHVTTGGFLRHDTEYSYKKSWQNIWSKCSEEERKCFTSLPNFNAKIFEEITGINVNDNDEIEVIIQGVTKKIAKTLAQQLGLL